MSVALRLTNFAFDHLVNQWGALSRVFDPVVNFSPLVFRVRITNRCNLSCHYCYVGKSLNQKVENLLNVDEWKMVLKNLPRHTLIDITGGEPLLTPKIDEILNEMLDRKFKISLITNGTVYKETLFKTMVEKKLSHFMISFDGNEVAHDAIRGLGNFERALKTAKKIIEYKKELGSRHPLLVAKITYTEENYHDVDKLIKYLVDDIGFDGATVNLLFDNEARDGFPNGKALKESKFQAGNVVQFSSDKAAMMGEELVSLLEKYSGKVQVRPEIKTSEVKNYFIDPQKFSPKNCYKYRSVLTMYSDGTLTPCDLGIEVGNIREEGYDVKKTISRAKMKSFFEGFQKQENLPGCQGCCLKKHEMVQ